MKYRTIVADPPYTDIDWANAAVKELKRDNERLARQLEETQRERDLYRSASELGGKLFGDALARCTCWKEQVRHGPTTKSDLDCPAHGERNE